MAKPPKSAGHRLWEKHARSEVLGHGVRVRRLPRRDPPGEEGHPRDPAIFAANLRELTGQAGLTPAEVAAQLGLSRRWYVRLMAHGLARIDKRTCAGLEHLVHLFGLRRVEELWDPNLERLRPRAGVDQKILSWSQKAHWPYAEKLLELLETGEHDFLKGLIDSLHGSEQLKAGVKEGANPVPAEPQSAHTSGLRRRLGRNGPDH
jgi:hypothetical protein